MLPMIHFDIEQTDLGDDVAQVTIECECNPQTVAGCKTLCVCLRR